MANALPPPPIGISKSDPPRNVRVVQAWQTLATAVIFALTELAVVIGCGFLVFHNKMGIDVAGLFVGPIVGAASLGRLKGKPMSAALVVMMIGSALGVSLGRR